MPGDEFVVLPHSQPPPFQFRPNLPSPSLPQPPAQAAAGSDDSPDLVLDGRPYFFEPTRLQIGSGAWPTPESPELFDAGLRVQLSDLLGYIGIESENDEQPDEEPPPNEEAAIGGDSHALYSATIAYLADQGTSEEVTAGTAAAMEKLAAQAQPQVTLALSPCSLTSSFWHRVRY